MPFVLSWSALDTMAAGYVVIATDTSLVKEVIKHSTSGLLFDFFSPTGIADAVDEVLKAPDRI